MSTANGDPLSGWNALLATKRTFYGDDENNKPNEYCFWDDDGIPAGWYETDTNLKKRINEKLNNK